MRNKRYNQSGPKGFLSGAIWKGFYLLAILCLHSFHKLGSVPLHRNWFTNQKRCNTGDKAHTCKVLFLATVRAWIAAGIPCKWNMELSLRMVSCWFSSWLDTPPYHPVLVLPGHLSLFHLTYFLIYRVSLLRTGLTWDLASRWLRPINYLATCNRVVAKVFSLQLLPLTQLGRLSVNYLRLPSSALGSASVELLLFWTSLVFESEFANKATTPRQTTQSLHNMLIIWESNGIIFGDLKWPHGRQL